MEVMVLDAFRSAGTLLVVCLACREGADGSLTVVRKEISQSLSNGLGQIRNQFAEAFIQACWREFDVVMTDECLAIMDAEKIAFIEVLRGKTVKRPALEASSRLLIDETLDDLPSQTMRSG